MNKKCSAELDLTTPISQASEKFQDALLTMDEVDKANGDTCCEHYLLEHRRSNTASSSEAVEEVNVQRSEGPLLSKLALRVPIFLPTLEIIHRLSAPLSIAYPLFQLAGLLRRWYFGVLVLLGTTCWITQMLVLL